MEGGLRRGWSRRQEGAPRGALVSLPAGLLPGPLPTPHSTPLTPALAPGLAACPLSLSRFKRGGGETPLKHSLQSVSGNSCGAWVGAGGP